MLDNSAKTLGLTFPITLLDRAEEVIERLVSFWQWVQSVNATRLVVYRRVFQSPRSFVGVD
jgi:hypothetical protein